MFEFLLSSIVIAVTLFHAGALSFVPNKPSTPIAVVFGAGLATSTQPSVVLQDRLDTAYDLYIKGVVEQVFLSGDSTRPSHDEVGVMKLYLGKKGVPSTAMIADTQGVDTYSTCNHAFQQGFSRVVLVTQSFHMPRAIYLCKGVGLITSEAIADKREYDPINTEREKKAMGKAWLQLHTTISSDQMKLLEAIMQ